MTENQLEQETLGWLSEVGYSHLYAPDIAPDSDNAERDNYQQVILLARLRDAIYRLNPNVPNTAKEDALKQVVDPTFRTRFMNKSAGIEGRERR